MNIILLRGMSQSSIEDFGTMPLLSSIRVATFKNVSMANPPPVGERRVTSRQAEDILKPVPVGAHSKFFARVISMEQERLCRLQLRPDSFRNVSCRRARPKRPDCAGEVVQGSPPDAHGKERPQFYHTPVHYKQT